MIKVSNLYFDYPGIRALDDVTCTVERQKICALVGPNGAGKTTLLRCIAALEYPLSGTVLVNDLDVTKHPRECHRNMGYLPDFYGLYQDLTVAQSLQYSAAAHGIKENLEQTVQRAAQRLPIADRLNQKVGGLSRGLSQRLAIAQAIVHEPPVLLLDEPASGLDPDARRDLSQLFLQLRNDGITLLVSSHILAELDEYCDSMLIVRNGKIVDHEKPQTEQEPKRRVRLTTSDATSLINILEKLDITIEQTDGNEIFISMTDSDESQTQLIHDIIDGGGKLIEIARVKHNLQDSYHQAVKHADKN